MHAREKKAKVMSASRLRRQVELLSSRCGAPPHPHPHASGAPRGEGGHATEEEVLRKERARRRALGLFLGCYPHHARSGGVGSPLHLGDVLGLLMPHVGPEDYRALCLTSRAMRATVRGDPDALRRWVAWHVEREIPRVTATAIPGPAREGGGRAVVVGYRVTYRGEERVLLGRDDECLASVYGWILSPLKRDHVMGMTLLSVEISMAFLLTVWRMSAR